VAQEPRVNRDQIIAMAKAYYLELPEDRIDSLVQMYNHFDEGFVKIRAIATGELEPTTLKPQPEVSL
jgi:hypothetical protein